MCFHNSMSAKAIKVAARYGRQSDVVEIYQSILDEQYHVNAFTFPRYRSTGFQLGTHPFLGKKRRGCDRNKKDDT